MIMRLFLALVCLLLAVIFGLAYYVQYFQWRECFNELGRCYDSATGTVFLEQSGMIWSSMSVIALVAAIWLTLKVLI
jgi:hypothetical protein